jgi:hypothetical protein
VEQVAVPWRLRAIPADALAPGPVGRLRPETIAELDQLLRLVLDSPEIPLEHARRRVLSSPSWRPSA